MVAKLMTGIVLRSRAGRGCFKKLVPQSDVSLLEFSARDHAGARIVARTVLSVGHAVRHRVMSTYGLIYFTFYFAVEKREKIETYNLSSFLVRNGWYGSTKSLQFTL